jgi:sigma-B regulation protein RsbU (phosphoserine phosphatase)
VTQLNRVLYPNIRARLERDDHATFMLLHFMGARVVFAGAHEDAIVYRAARGEVELIESNGVWIGMREEIGELTPAGEFSLEPGDIVVLYTDGIVEARNAEREQFGLERIIAHVRENASESVQTILERIVAAGRAFCPVQQDDMSCLVLRYKPDSARSSA